MDQHQRSLRSEAAKAFIESLDQLEVCWQSQEEGLETEPTPTAESAAEHPSCTAIDLNALEEAAADIERFMKEKEQDQG